MTLSQEQLEWIVSEVVRRLRAGGAREPAKSPAAAGTLNIVDRLVTLETLRGQLTGVSHVKVGVNAVVTPAVRDLLKERQVQLVKA